MELKQGMMMESLACRSREDYIFRSYSLVLHRSRVTWPNNLTRNKDSFARIILVLDYKNWLIS